MLESAYKECLAYELNKSGLYVEKEKPLPLVYETITLEYGYRLDLLINNMVIVELKSIESFTVVQFAQLMTYLKFSGCQVGLLINFNVRHLKDGIRRIVLNFNG